MANDTPNVKYEYKSPDGAAQQSSSKVRLLLRLLQVLLVLILLATFALVLYLVLHTIESDSNAGESGEYVSVELPQGKLHGKVVRSPQGKQIEQYLGIPFAQKPIGARRWADPEPLPRFETGEHKAYEYGNTCPHFPDTTFGDFRGSDMWNSKTPLKEDCLNLNVWTPSPSAHTRRPVLVWIFGGGFYSGSSSLWVYDGKALATRADMVVVSMNYRLNSLGFLSTGDGKIKGNFGLKDQQLALKWVHDNIAKFGGDPNLVTIYGESAGGASVGYHMMSDGSKDYFRRAIIASSSPDAKWAHMDEATSKIRSDKFFRATNCTEEATRLTCLRNLPIDTILASEAVETAFLTFPFVPCTDGEFIKDSPRNLIMTGGYADKDVLMGHNKDEGTFWLVYAIEALTKDGPSPLTKAQFEAAIDYTMAAYNATTKADIIKLYAPNDVNDGEGNRDALDDAVGDVTFICPSLSLAGQFAMTGLKTYYYYLTYRSSEEVWPPWMGVIHGADVQWPFGMPKNRKYEYNDNDLTFSETVMDYWINFIRYGNPNGATVPHWPPNSAWAPSYLELRGPGQFIPHLNSKLRRQYCKFWDALDHRS